MLMGAGAPAALADDVNSNTVVRTLTCDDGTSFTAQWQRPDTSAALPNTFRLVDSTATFAWRHLRIVSPTGEVVHEASTGLQGAERNHELKTCSFVSLASGNTFYLTGFLTPAG